MQTAKEALESAIKMWTEIVEEQYSSKEDVMWSYDLLYQCNLCQYVSDTMLLKGIRFQKESVDVHGGRHLRSNLMCKDFCPVGVDWILYDGEERHEDTCTHQFMCESYRSPYCDWNDRVDEATDNANIVLDVLHESLRKLLEDKL